jgi:membrane protein
MSYISSGEGTAAAPAVEQIQTPGKAPVAAQKPHRRLHLPFQTMLIESAREGYFTAVGKYLTRTEVHTFAFSVAANVILSFFPFIVLLLTLTRQVFHSWPMYEVVLQMLRSYLPAGQDFIVRSVVALTPRSGMKIFSLFMLLFSSTGVFVPLEVALNHVWGFAKNRKYIANQVISLLLAFSCGLLALASVALTAKNETWMLSLLGSKDGLIFKILAFIVMKSFAFIASVAMFFLVYWILPNGKVRALTVLPAAVLTGLVWDISKYLYIVALRWLDFQQVYGPFALSVTLMFWAFLSGMLLLAGAQLSVLRVQHVTASHI